VYQGFALHGKPDGRGQWVSYDKQHTYAGDWRAGDPHGCGKQVNVQRGETYSGDFRDGCWGATGYIEQWGGPWFHETCGGIPCVDKTWEEDGRRYGIWQSGGAPNPNKKRYVMGTAPLPVDTQPATGFGRP
jgi:hypothetical protein